LSCKLTLCCSTVTDVGGLVESAGFRLLENMKASAMAVSGTRKVACVVSDSSVNWFSECGNDACPGGLQVMPTDACLNGYQ